MNIFLIDPFPEETLVQIRALGHAMRYEPGFTKAEVMANLADVDILVMNSKVNADAELLAHGPNLKMICRAGVGMDHFDLPLLERKGILAFNTPGANAIPVGEQAIGMLLSMMHCIVRADRQVHSFLWEREQNRGTELQGKTVGIIGYGNTGSSFARCIAGFGCRVLAYDKYKSGFGDHLVEEVGLDEIFGHADVLTLHIPLTDETNGWVNETFFGHFAKPIWFLNLSRGPIAPMAGILKGLHGGKLLAAGLDVLENEKLDTLTALQKQQLQALLADNRVIITPHIGGWSHESLRRINDRLVQGIARFIAENEGR